MSDGEIYQGGAGYNSQAEAIEGMYEAVGDRFKSINVVVNDEPNG